jgi:glycosyltransferase involved in cell wall biosynthesis
MPPVTETQTLAPVQGPPIRIYIPVRNGADYIRDCIDSIINQTYGNWILTVSDNRSSDETASIVASFSDPRIIYYRQARDIGMIANFNSCIDRCDSEYYAILSHDDKYCSPTALEEAITVLNRHKDVAAVYSNIVWIDGHGTKIVEFKLPRRGMVASDAQHSIISCRNFFGVPILLRTSAVGSHRYDERFKRAADVDLSVAVGQRKYMYVMDEPKVAIRFHKTNNTMRDFAGVRNEMLLIAEKHGITLSWAQRVRMYLNDRITRVKKTLFFFYIDGKA